MKPIIYVDILFLINFLMDSIIIYATALFLKRSVHIIRLMLSASLSALYATVMFFPQLSVMYSFIFKIIALFIVVTIAFPTKALIRNIKNAVVFFITNAVFGGISFSLIFLTDFGVTVGAAISNGEIYLNINTAALLFSAAIAYITVYVLSRVRKHMEKQNRFINQISISFENKTTMLKALADTGCMAEEPLTKASVIIISSDSAKKIIPTEFTDALNRNFSESSDEKYIKRYRVIPYNTIESSGFMDAFTADMAIINNNKIKTPVIGIAKKNLSADLCYEALFNPDICN